MYLPCLTNVTSGIRMAARIVDAPCNEMNVSAFLEEAKIVAKETNSELTIIQGEELKEKGLNGIYYVGKAASCPPALAVLSKVHPNATTTIAWVGKGIVYDCGGLSLKSKTEMPGMKADCGGAAAILGAFSAAVKLGFNQNLHAVLCLAENAIGPNATRNDDIQTFYSGRTVEINNTDAEGRIVLADGVVYASRDLNATIILDMATLTGAQGTSTGKYHGGLLSNSQEWEECSVRAGKACGDLLMPMVYSPELHFSEFASVVADMKNSVADRYNAQASCAGLFILSHLGFDFNGAWIHVDMAELAVSGERATGYGVALLVTMFCEYIDDKLLNSLKKQVAMPGGQSVKDSSRKRLRLN
uniref:Cytosol aminopeptidase domain-containing protein n=1 Tax=Clastoptera arizonana TaxID=38151 RepID=A0A1B6CMZ9_9HEMI